MADLFGLVMVGRRYYALGNPDKCSAYDLALAMSSKLPESDVVSYRDGAFRRLREALSLRRAAVDQEHALHSRWIALCMAVDWAAVTTFFQELQQFESSDADELDGAAALMFALEDMVTTAAQKALLAHPQAAVDIAKVLTMEDRIRKQALVEQVRRLVANNPGFDLSGVIAELKNIQAEADALLASAEAGYEDVADKSDEDGTEGAV